MKSLVSWSGGKDCMQALHQFIQNTGSKPDGLLTAYSLSYNRVTMHGVRMELIELQAHALGIPLYTLGLPENVTNELYEELLLDKFRELMIDGFTDVVFGDIYLEDLRDYRIRQLKKVGLNYQFPIWKTDTRKLIHELVLQDYKAMIVSINGTILTKHFAGRLIDQKFIEDLPSDVDPCGENGEFHTFVFDGPTFETPVSFEKGETIKRTYESPLDGSEVVYWFTDLIPD